MICPLYLDFLFPLKINAPLSFEFIVMLTAHTFLSDIYFADSRELHICSILIVLLIFYYTTIITNCTVSNRSNILRRRDFQALSW